MASQGIDKNLAHQARVLGALSEDKFEQAISDARDAVSRAVKTVVRKAVDWLIEEQRKFVAWWDQEVGVRRSAAGGSENRASSADLRSTLSCDKAEEQTGISHQQVSRWRRGLRRCFGVANGCRVRLLPTRALHRGDAKVRKSPRRCTLHVPGHFAAGYIQQPAGRKTGGFGVAVCDFKAG